MDGSQAVIIDRGERGSTQTAPQELFSITKEQITYRFYDAADQRVRAHFHAPQREVMVAEFKGSWGVVVPRLGVIGDGLCQISREDPDNAVWVGPGEAAEEVIMKSIRPESWKHQGQIVYRQYNYRRAIMTMSPAG